MNNRLFGETSAAPFRSAFFSQKRVCVWKTTSPGFGVASWPLREVAVGGEGVSGRGAPLAEGGRGRS